MVPTCAEASTTEEPDAEKTARPGLCGGRRVTGVPTAELQTMWVRSLDCGLVAMIVGRVAVNLVPTAVPVAINLVPRRTLIAVPDDSYCGPLQIALVSYAWVSSVE
jgi:hypothetical protein